jgi:hypothetical protein
MGAKQAMVVLVAATVVPCLVVARQPMAKRSRKMVMWDDVKL